MDGRQGDVREDIPLSDEEWVLAEVMAPSERFIERHPSLTFADTAPRVNVLYPVESSGEKYFKLDGGVCK